MRDNPNSLMLFAAGLGTRMGDLVRQIPKPLIPVAGKPLIDHALEIANDANIGNVVVNTHYKSEKMVAHLQGRPIQISHEAPMLLETGGGLRNALPLLGNGPVFTLNSDAVWAGKNPLTQLSKFWNPDFMDALLLLVRPQNAYGYSGAGDFLAPDGDHRIRRGPGLVYSGAQITITGDLHNIDKDAFSLNIVWNVMLKRNRVYGIIYDGIWCDVGRPDGIDAAEKMLAAQNV